METIPTLDAKVLQEKTNEYALKGAQEVIKEFYSGYESPYKKALRKAMDEQPLGFNFGVPDIIAKINDAIAVEVDTLANAAIAKTYLPMVKEFLTRAEPVIRFSDFLREVIKDLDIETTEDLELEMGLNSKYGWYDISITTEQNTWSVTLHECWDKEDKEKKYYQFLSLPNIENSHSRYMKLKVDNATLEIPFTSNILNDKVARLVATYIIGKTKVVVDTTELEEDFFPEKCHC